MDVGGATGAGNCVGAATPSTAAFSTVAAAAADGTVAAAAADDVSAVATLPFG